MKCPKCGTDYDDSYKFCPYCADKNPLVSDETAPEHPTPRPAPPSFTKQPPTDQETSPPSSVGLTPSHTPASAQELAGRIRRSFRPLKEHWKLTLVISIIALAVAGGLIGFFSWKAANDNKIVTVKNGTIYKCTQCGVEYNNEVKTLRVKNKDKGNYKVVTKEEGVCDSCAYGPKGAEFKAVFDILSSSKFFESTVEIPPAAIEFLKAHADCFPAASQAVAASVTNQVDPRLVNRDYTPYTGTLIQVYGSVIKTESVPYPSGKLTFLQISPENSTDSWFVFYPADTDILDGDYGNFWVLPIDVTQYKATMGTRNALVVLCSWCEKAKKPWE